MCVIISRNPGIEIDQQKIESALSSQSSHGFGISIIDRGKIETIREYKDSGNCSKRVLKILGGCQGSTCICSSRFLWLTGKERRQLVSSVPPFRGDDNETHVHAQRNVVLYGNDDVPDSREFAEKSSHPMTEAFYASHGEMLPSLIQLTRKS